MNHHITFLTDDALLEWQCIDIKLQQVIVDPEGLPFFFNKPSESRNLKKSDQKSLRSRKFSCWQHGKLRCN